MRHPFCYTAFNFSVQAIYTVNYPSKPVSTSSKTKTPVFKNNAIRLIIHTFITQDNRHGLEALISTPSTKMGGST